MAKAKKSLGQHFLTSRQVVTDIVRAAYVTKDDTVLEIGPGKGVLTRALLNDAKQVIAIEKDNDLIPYLEEKFKEEIRNKSLVLIHDDVRNVELKKHVDGPYKVVANIPYYITGELIEFFLAHVSQPTTIVFLVQKEVALRIAKEKKESVLSLSVKVYGEPRYVRTVKASLFKPKPSVDSAILAIGHISRNFFEKVDEKKFFEIVKKGFSQKRKLLIGNLSSFGKREVLEEVFKDCGVSQKTRAENLTKEQWRCVEEHL